MANFCGGDFYSLPDRKSIRSNYGARRPSESFAKPTAGQSGRTLRAGAAAMPIGGQSGGKTSRGAALPTQGVSQWGRQQLGYTNVKEGARGGREQQRRGRGIDWNESSLSLSYNGTHETRIQDLSPHQGDTHIIGIVVMKRSIQSFPDKRNPGSKKFKFTFTLRDTPSDYINVTCWGSETNYITNLHDSFKICDIVELVNGQILSKTEAEEKWTAWTPSLYHINISENYSSLSLYSGPSRVDMSSLAHAPLRPIEDCHTLSSIVASGQSIDGSHVSILAAVRHVGKPKEMVSKNGRQIKKCEVKVMDADCSSFNILIWDEEVIELAQTWTPQENIIFAVDVKASFDTYRNMMTGVCDQKTLIVTNPECKEAHELFQFAQSVEILSNDDESSDVSIHPQESVAIEDIYEVFSVEDIKQKQEEGMLTTSSASWGGSGSTQPQSFTGIVYAYLTTLNITSDDTSAVVCYRCSSCNFRGQVGAHSCSNKNCPSSISPLHTSLTASDIQGHQPFTVEPQFNLLVSFSDHTGGVEGVWLAGKTANDTLKITPEEFLTCTSEQRISLKSSILLEKFKVYFKSGVCMADRKKPPIKILSMNLADSREVLAHMGGM